MIFQRNKWKKLKSNTTRNNSETDQDGLEGYREEAKFQEGVDCSQTTQILQAP